MKSYKDAKSNKAIKISTFFREDNFILFFSPCRGGSVAFYVEDNTHGCFDYCINDSNEGF